MSVVETAAPVLAPTAHALGWPEPHHMRVVDSAASTDPERATVTLNDGSKVLGDVVHLDLEAETLELRPVAGATRVLPFSSFRGLFLVRTIELERIPLAVPPGSVEALPLNATRKCAIELTDGATLEADVVSVLPAKPGLFLFVADYSDQILRWFIPAHALASYRLGEPLGQALCERNALARETLEAGLQAQRRLKDSRIGGYLTDRGIVTGAQLESALARQKTMSHLRLGDALVQEQLITPAQRDAALATQAADRGKLLGEILVDMGAVTREDIRHVLAEQLGVPSVTLSRFQYDPEAVKAISAELARKHTVMPLYRTSTRIAVGIENPMCWQALRELEASTGLKVDPAMAAREDLLAAITRFYGTPPSEAHVAPVALVAAAVPASEFDETVARLVNGIIVEAFDRGASDIHIETLSRDQPSRVRLRVDGALAPYIEVPPELRAALLSRIKGMGALDISERRRPQNGRIRFSEHGPRNMELRVMTMPTANGLEDVVMRILAGPRALTLDQLAFPARVLPDLKAMVARSFGLLLVCGPTGSGKTTTLHSLLSHINTPQRKIWTVEDPIEISQDGLCQVQVNANLGLAFPEVLASFLRADPDVIMVGEMRDAETARMAIAACLTGHLVLSAMQTDGAVDGATRLLDLGVDSFNFADALIGIVGQRLVRRLCTACRSAHVASDAEVDELAQLHCRGTRLLVAEVAARWRKRYGSSEGALTLHAPAGCSACDRSGYKGRMGVFELLVASPAIKASIQARSASAQIAREAAEGGMTTLLQDGIDKVLQGHLDLRQVRQACL